MQFRVKLFATLHIAQVHYVTRLAYAITIYDANNDKMQ